MAVPDVGAKEPFVPVPKIKSIWFPDVAVIAPALEVLFVIFMFVPTVEPPPTPPLNSEIKLKSPFVTDMVLPVPVPEN